MVRVVTFFGMTLGAFMFWQTMDRLHVWIALHQDEKDSWRGSANLVLVVLVLSGDKSFRISYPSLNVSLRRFWLSIMGLPLLEKGYDTPLVEMGIPRVARDAGTASPCS
ncbi:hypothetical protein EJ110_NYTH39938 [Nymphaea thermarum]|nr:hypothetical protein EJ110_NYTH39938 [Nymphaea thermarum]